MAKSSSVIEINGNQYDAVTGQLVGAVKRAAAQVNLPSGSAIDGFVKRAAPTKSRIKHTAKEVHKGAERSKTLMRNIVSKPLQPAPIQSKPLVYKARTASVNSDRLSKAKDISQNHMVHHFGHPEAKHTAKTAPVIKTQVRPLNAQPKASTAVAPALPSMITSVSHQQLERLLDNALARADAHKKMLQMEGKSRLWRKIWSTPKWLSVGASLAIALLLGGFFAWQNIPQVSMKMANLRAHVSASVPNYTPSGFGYAAPINYSSSGVTINFKAKANPGQSFTLTQQKSNWDSTSLAANALPANTQVQTSQVNGTTIYIYGSSNDATWVNNGIKYTLKDQANLTSDQILKIAGSL